MWRSRTLYLAMAFVGCAGGAAARPAPAQVGVPRPGPATPSASLAIIVNTQNPLDELSIGQLRLILVGEMTRWPDGRKVTVAARGAGHPEREAVLRLVCRMSDQAFTRLLLQATFRGEFQAAPKVLDTSTLVRRFVFNVPGAIGYVRSDEVDRSVKVMRIVGEIPEAPAFGFTLQVR